MTVGRIEPTRFEVGLNPFGEPGDPAAPVLPAAIADLRLSRFDEPVRA
ncbi:hypothetical protein [Nonomuraea sp. NPDC049709]